MLLFNKTDGISAREFWQSHVPNCRLRDGTPALLVWTAGGIVGLSHPSENGAFLLLAGSPRGRIQMARFPCRAASAAETEKVILDRIASEEPHWFPHESVA